MMSQIEFYYDVSSPWTYLAFTNIQSLAAEEGATIHWKPFLVGGVFNAINPTMYRMRENPVPARDAWIKKDMQDLGLWPTREAAPSVQINNAVGAVAAAAQSAAPSKDEDLPGLSGEDLSAMGRKLLLLRSENSE